MLGKLVAFKGRCGPAGGVPGSALDVSQSRDPYAVNAARARDTGVQQQGARGHLGRGGRLGRRAEPGAPAPRRRPLLGVVCPLLRAACMCPPREQRRRSEAPGRHFPGQSGYHFCTRGSCCGTRATRGDRKAGRLPAAGVRAKRERGGAGAIALFSRQTGPFDDIGATVCISPSSFLGGEGR